MATGPDTLTDKEKDALRLLLRGHDAKSSARALGLSVHTVNERLRDARRKLGVTSSREAARLLMAEEGEGDPEKLRDKPLGDAAEGAASAQLAASANPRRAGPRPALVLAGVTAMTLVLAAALFAASPLSIMSLTTATPTDAAEPEAGAAVRAAENFLELIDKSRWAESYAATGSQFRQLNTLDVWSEVSERVRPPLGEALTRDLVANEYVPAPPEGYRLVKFRSTYANGTQQMESVSLEWEDGAWKVAGIVIG